MAGKRAMAFCMRRMEAGSKAHGDSISPTVLGPSSTPTKSSTLAYSK